MSQKSKEHQLKLKEIVQASKEVSGQKERAGELRGHLEQEFQVNSGDKLVIEKELAVIAPLIEKSKKNLSLINRI